MAHISRIGYIDTSATDTPAAPLRTSRGTPPALVEHPVFATTDLRRAQRDLGQILGTTTITPPGRSPDCPTAVHAIRLRGVTYGHIDLPGETELHLGPSADAYLVVMPGFGETHLRLADRPTATARTLRIGVTEAAIIDPGSYAHLLLGPDNPLLFVRIERAALHRRLSRMLGRSPDSAPRFEPLWDLSAAAAMRWTSALQLVAAEAMSPDSLLRRGVDHESLEDLLVSALLLAQPHTLHAELLGPSGSHRPLVARALAYIDAHLAEPITVPGIAAACGCSARTLQAAFREDLDQSPATTVRTRRLDRVYGELAQAQDASLTVSATAHRWGFHHMGSFAVMYRERFGCTPSETLRGEA